MLRCVQLGISIAELDNLTIGLVMDMFTEYQNDEYYSENEELTGDEAINFLGV